VVPIADARQEDQGHPQCMRPGMIDQLQTNVKCNVDYVMSKPRKENNIKHNTQKNALINNQATGLCQSPDMRKT